MYSNDNKVRSITSLKPHIDAMAKSKDWVCIRFGRVNKPSKDSNNIQSTSAKSSVSRSRITATFQYRGKNG